jgi:hypothetical protein
MDWANLTYPQALVIVGFFFLLRGGMKVTVIYRDRRNIVRDAIEEMGK